MEGTPTCNPTNETEFHIRNLVLNSNITITTASSQQKSYRECERTKENINIGKKANFCSVRVSSDEKSTVPPKRPKHVKDDCEISTSLNPFASLPISLISNGTLSVTSESACVAIENGVPILKEACSSDKLSFISKDLHIPSTTLTPIGEINSTIVGVSSKVLQANESCDVKSTAKDLYNHNTSPKNIKPPFICLNNQASASASQSNDKYSTNQKLRTEETPVDSFCQAGLIPNPNQIDFLTLLGLEIVVNSCCQNEVPNESQPNLSQIPTICVQCQTDFTKQWHFCKGESEVQCNRCFAYNKQQIKKAQQTVLLTKEYEKTLHDKQQIKRKSCTAQSVGLVPLKFPCEQDQHELFEKYIKAASAFSDDYYISDLTKLGAWIASNSSVFQAAKTVNSLNHSSTPLTRARAVQSLQIALFKGIHNRLSLLNPIEFMMQDQPLLCCQLAIARMYKEANFSALIPENPNANTPLEPIVRAMEAQNHNLTKSILHQVPTTPVLSKIDN